MPEPEINKVNRLLAVLTERVDSIDKARELQAVELSRRLDELNHAAKRLADDKLNYFSLPAAEQFQKQFEQFVRDQRTDSERIHSALAEALSRRDFELRHNEVVAKIGNTISREIFDQSQKDLLAWRDGVKDTLAEAKGRATVLAAIFGATSAAIATILMHFWK